MAKREGFLMPLRAKSRSTWLPPVLGLVVMSCVEAKGISDRAAIVTDSAGVPFVMNPVMSPLTLVHEEARRIGEVVGEDPYLFGDVVDVSIVPGDTVLVADRHTTTIRVFSPDGTFVREFLRKGNGPSELRDLRELRTSGSTQVATDYARVVAFSTSGEFIASGRSAGPAGEIVSPRARWDSVWVSLVYSAFDFTPKPIGTRTEWARQLATTSDGGSVIEELVALPPKTIFASEAMGGRPDWPLLDPTLEVGVDGQQRIFVPAVNEYRVNMYDRNGQIRRVIRRKHELVRVTDEEVSQFLERAVRLLSRDNPGSREGFERRLRAQADNRISDVRPPLGRILVAPDGSFWVERLDRQPLLETELRALQGRVQMGLSESHWDLYDEEGKLLGETALPADFTPFAVLGRQVTGVHRDALDVDFVVTFLVRAANR